jgi:hypothetical protein
MVVNKEYKTQLLKTLKTKNEYINSLKAQGLDQDPRFQD